MGTSAVLDCHLVATSPTVMWHLDAVLKQSVVGAGELAHLGSLLSVPVHVCMLSCPHHRVIVIIPLVGHVVVPSLSCVSARWVGTNVGWGYLLWHPKVRCHHSSVVVCHITYGDMAPGFLCKKRRVVLMLLTCLVSNVCICHCHVSSSFSHCWLAVIVQFCLWVLAIVCEPWCSVSSLGKLGVV